MHSLNHQHTSFSLSGLQDKFLKGKKKPRGARLRQNSSMLILFSCGGVSCTALLNMGSERMNYLLVKVWETAAEAPGSCNIWRCWTGARAAGPQEPEPPLFLVGAPPCRSNKETEISYEFYSAEKEKEKKKVLQLCRKQRCGGTEKARRNHARAELRRSQRTRKAPSLIWMAEIT